MVRETIKAWNDDYAPSMGAALSYYTLFSIAPLLLIVLAIAGLVFGEEAARGELFGQISALVGPESARAIEALLASANRPRAGAIAVVTGALGLLAGASAVFGELQNALDRIWRAPARQQQSGWFPLIRSRLLSFGMILAVAFLLMVSLAMSAVLA